MTSITEEDELTIPSLTAALTDQNSMQPLGVTHNSQSGCTATVLSCNKCHSHRVVQRRFGQLNSSQTDAQVGEAGKEINYRVFKPHR